MTRKTKASYGQNVFCLKQNANTRTSDEQVHLQEIIWRSHSYAHLDNLLRSLWLQKSPPKWDKET